MLHVPSLELLTRKLGRHVALGERERQAILALPMTARTLENAAYIVREGETPARCAVLLSGFAFRQKLSGDGARQILSLHLPGDPLDLENLDLDVADHNVQTLTRATVALIPRPAFRKLVDDYPAIRHAILVDLLAEASVTREWLLNIGRRDARARIAHLLCEFAMRLEAQGLAEEYGYELPMTQEQLGDALGLTSVHVNRTLKALERDELIRRDGRRISFPNWNALRDTGDFSSRYLHLERAPLQSAA